MSQHLSGVGARAVRNFNAPQHSSQFFDPFRRCQRPNGRACGVAIRQLVDSQVLMPLAGNLGEVRNAQNLRAQPEFP